MAGTARCPNPLCASATRWFRWNIAAAVRSGPVEAALNAYKYRGARQWAPVFGGMLAELMERRRHLVEPFDLITASPTFVGRSDRDFDHTRSMLVEAAHLVPSGRAWPFDTGPVPAIVKMRPTPRPVSYTHLPPPHIDICRSVARSITGLIDACQCVQWGHVRRHRNPHP